ncbi:MFS transporter [Kribbella sandramycini]|uniref:MFS family permease n=1 Tax=Kribbella sandramycini TaxID=60450 RepID=A0A7Y4L3F6_9ACTN|nr:MFS transporter [Kribbella sandramycini]MBB6570986.1 MFS family permease [Kribbella sandramycini]NOL43604.1 MFS transporter [Kribbella sandramycini]
MSGRTALLRDNRDFSRFWWGQALTALGARVSDVCIPLLVLDLTGSALWAGALLTVRLIVLNVARLPAGALADRWDRRTVMIVVDLLRAVLWAVLAVAILTGVESVWPLAIVGVVDGLVSSIYNPSLAAALRHLVRPDDITKAVSLNESRSYAASLIGPAVGGGLYAVAHWIPFAVNAVTFLFCTYLVIRITSGLGGRHVTQERLTSDMWSGLRYVFTQPFLRTLTLWSAVLNFATAAAFFGMVPMLVGLKTPAAVIGAMSAVTAAGALLGSLIAPRLVATGAFRAVILGGVVVAGAVTAVAVVPSMPVVVAALALLGATAPVLIIAMTAEVYHVVDDSMMARAQSTMTLVGSLLYPISTIVMGWLLQYHGPGPAYGVMAVALAGCVLFTLARPVRAQLSPEPVASRPLVPEESRHAY